MGTRTFNIQVSDNQTAKVVLPLDKCQEVEYHSNYAGKHRIEHLIMNENYNARDTTFYEDGEPISTISLRIHVARTHVVFEKKVLDKNGKLTKDVIKARVDMPSFKKYKDLEVINIDMYSRFIEDKEN